MALLLLSKLSSLSKFHLLALQVVLLAVMLFAAYRTQAVLMKARLQGFEINAAAMAMVTDVHDAEQLFWANYQPEWVLTLVPYIRENRLSVFSEPQSWLLGKPLESAFSLAPSNQCAGELESIVTVGGGGVGQQALRITGWAWDYKRREPPSAIVAATDGIITGLGAMGDYRPINKTLRPWIKSNYIGYTGYLHRAGASGPIEVYAILKGRPTTACVIATVK